MDTAVNISSNQVHVIFNPAARAGQAEGMKTKIQSLLGQHFGENYQFHSTTAPENAIKISKELAQSGVELIVAAGGDGTIQEVLNGLYQDHKLINPKCQLGIINLGTGQGLARSLELPATLEEQIALLKSKHERPVDIGKVTYYTQNGEPKEKLFINECQIGIGGQVVRGVNRKYKRLGGKMAFGLVTLQHALLDRPFLANTSINHEPLESAKYLGMVIANGCSMGGGMLLAPDANLSDGQFDTLLIHQANIFKRLAVFPKIYSGKHLSSKYFSLKSCQQIEVDTETPIPVEADGEFLGWTPAHIEMLPEPLIVKAKF